MVNRTKLRGRFDVPKFEQVIDRAFVAATGDVDCDHIAVRREAGDAAGRWNRRFEFPGRWVPDTQSISRAEQRFAVGSVPKGADIAGLSGPLALPREAAHTIQNHDHNANGDGDEYKDDDADRN